MFLLVSGLALGSQEAAARDKKATYGRLEISTTPESYPLLIDGSPNGTTAGEPRMVDLPPGRHSVEIQFPSGVRWVREFDVQRGKRQCIVLNYKPRIVTITPPKSPCPFPVTISSPVTVNDGDLITFSSDVGYRGDSPLTYTWTITPASAHVVSGAGTNTITVDTTGLGRQRVTAALLVDDGSGNQICRQVARAETGVTALPPPPVKNRKFDEFPSIAFDDDKARLDNLAIEMQNDPNATGFVIVYGGRNSRVGQADRLGARAIEYLTTARGLDARRLVLVNGGYRETDYFELWIVPQGAELPTPSPTVQPGDVHPGKTPAANRRSRRRK
jgi:hypothetical protein